MPSRFKILMYEPMHQVGTRLLEEKCDLVYADSLAPDHLAALARDVDGIIIRANGAVTEEIITAAPHLRVIARHGVGLEGIDLRAAKVAGVKVVYTPNANKESVAEHFVALCLMLAKKIRQGDKALREGRWSARYELIGTQLRGRTLGVLGFGRIGRQTAHICRYGFEMPVIYYDVADDSDLEKELEARRLPLEDVCARADFISINLPLLPSTRHVINRDLIKRMKSTAYLVNMSRGPIWCEADVAEALASGTIAGAGSDVYEVEPAAPDHPLFAFDNFVGTPHMSAHTEEGMIQMSLCAVDVLAVLEGREPEYPVPER